MAHQPTEKQTPRFATVANQLLVAVGADAQVEMLRRILQSLNFVQLKTAKTVKDVDPAAPFLVIIADFANASSVQNFSKFVHDLNEFTGTKLLFAINPVQLSNEELLLGVELGIKQTFFGPKRDEELKSFIKQRAIENADTGSMAHVESEVLKAIKRKDNAALGLWYERLTSMPKTSEDANRLLALLCEEKRDYKRMVFHLKQTLSANPQNLWAANKLGQYYLRNRQIAEGIEILKRMSRFHELNSERMLVLGDAYLNVGRTSDAEKVLEQGNKLTGGKDARFQVGLAKVDVMKGEPSKALERLGRKHLGTTVLSFLNTRAVMAVRNGNVTEGLQLYQQAISGCDPEQVLVLARILFNQGLAFIRNGQVNQAEAAFQRSLELGGAAFDRAAKPLAITRQVIARQQTQKISGDSMVSQGPIGLDSAYQSLDDFEYEKFS